VGGLRRDRGCPAAREPQIGSGADEELGDRHVPGDDRTKSLFHLHHDRAELAWVLPGEITVLTGDQVRVAGPGTCAFPLPRLVRRSESLARPVPRRQRSRRPQRPPASRPRAAIIAARSSNFFTLPLGVCG
jgi:hypothetical protein